MPFILSFAFGVAASLLLPVVAFLVVIAFVVIVDSGVAIFDGAAFPRTLIIICVELASAQFGYVVGLTGRALLTISSWRKPRSASGTASGDADGDGV